MSEPLFNLTVGTHFFRLNNLSVRMEKVANDFAYRFVKYGIVRQPHGRFIRQMVAVFAAATANRQEFRFHINSLQEFRNYLQEHYITSNLFTEQTLPIPEAEPLGLTIKPGWALYDYQLPVAEYLEAPPEPRAKFVGIQTGKGKTASATFAVVAFNKRIVVIIKPMYLEKWRDDFKKMTDATDEDIVSVRGSVALMTLLQMAKDDTLKAKIILMSNVTVQAWLKEYEKLGGAHILEQGYACVPEDLHANLKSGLRLVDEVHQDLHLNMKIDLYTQVEKSISLSATLLNNDSFIQKMQNLMYPPDQRYQGGDLDKYIETVAYLYHIRPERKYRTEEYGSVNYSHNMFERSILKDRDFMRSYFSLNKTIIDKGYIVDRKPGEKFAVFVASIAMATELTNYLAAAYPQLDVRRYVEDDPYENLLEPDIRVTTVLSGGTAHDIPNLLGALLTIGLDSVQANIQVLGRLRKLKDSQVVFYYLSCMDIPKQMQYHERKVRLFNERAKSLKIIMAQQSV